MPRPVESPHSPTNPVLKRILPGTDQQQHLLSSKRWFHTWSFLCVSLSQVLSLSFAHFPVYRRLEFNYFNRDTRLTIAAMVFLCMGPFSTWHNQSWSRNPFKWSLYHIFFTLPWPYLVVRSLGSLFLHFGPFDVFLLIHLLLTLGIIWELIKL